MCLYCQEDRKHKFLNQRMVDLSKKEKGYVTDLISLSVNQYGFLRAVAFDEEGNPIDESSVFVNFCPVCGRSLKHEDGFYEESNRWGSISSYEKR